MNDLGVNVIITIIYKMHHFIIKEKITGRSEKLNDSIIYMTVMDGLII